MANSNKVKGSGAKASDSSKKKQATAKQTNNKQNNEEWLESEVNSVDLEEPKSKKGKNVKEDADALMKQAAEQLESLQAEVKEWKDNYLRLHAEWDTYRRRSAEQREAEKATASEALVTDILPVLDDFERSINFAKENGEKGLLEGVEAVHSKLLATLQKNGTEVIEPAEGEAFNALEHQAVATVEDKEKFDESIASVMQKGYKMGNKVIRPAMVSVTTGGKKRPVEKTTETEDILQFIKAERAR